MWRTPLICVVVLAAGIVLSSLPKADAQRRVYDGRLNTQQLVRRLDDLERRVAELEANQPAKPRAESTVTVEQAERQVAIAKERQAFSEKLFRKGYISQTELDTDRFEFSRASKVVELAKAVRDGTSTAKIISEIEILDAEHYLAAAQAQLELAEKFAVGGFSRQSGLEGHRQAVREAEQRLEQARSEQQPSSVAP